MRALWGRWVLAGACCLFGSDFSSCRAGVGARCEVGFREEDVVFPYFLISRNFDRSHLSGGG